MQFSANLQCPEGRCATVLYLCHPALHMQLWSEDLCIYNKALQLQVHLQLSFSSNFNTTPELNGERKGVVSEDEGGHLTNGLANGHAEAALPASKYVGVQVSTCTFSSELKSACNLVVGEQMRHGRCIGGLDFLEGWQAGGARAGVLGTVRRCLPASMWVP